MNAILLKLRQIDYGKKAIIREKEAYIKEVAQKYYDEGLINIDIYNSLINYKVKTTD